MPIARGGSKPNGAKGKPVKLVRIAVARNSTVHAPNAVRAYQAVQHDKTGRHFDQADNNVKFEKRHVNPPAISLGR